MLLMMSVFFLMGGITETMAQYYRKYVTLAPGDTFYVNLNEITDGIEVIGLWIALPGKPGMTFILGTVSAYGKCCITPEDAGIYYFAVYKDGKWIYKMEVQLTVQARTRITLATIRNELERMNGKKCENNYLCVCRGKKIDEYLKREC